MIQIKVIVGADASELERKANEFLTTIETDCFKSIIPAKGSVLIVYEAKPEHSGRFCADCQYWDDGGSSDCVSGICHERGGRRRFNFPACERFKDIRR